MTLRLDAVNVIGRMHGGGVVSRSGQGVLRERSCARMAGRVTCSRFSLRVQVVERISDEHWREIAGEHPSLDLLESAVSGGVGEWAADNFRAYAIERLRRGDQKHAGPIAMEQVLRDIEVRRAEER